MKAVDDPEWANSHAGVSPTQSVRKFGAVQDDGTGTLVADSSTKSAKKDHDPFPFSSLRAIICCVKCSKLRGVYIRSIAPSAQHKRTTSMLQSYPPAVRPIIELNKNWQCGAQLMSDSTGVVACVDTELGCGDLLEANVIKVCWEHFHLSNGASNNAKLVFAVSDVTALTKVPCIFCGKSPSGAYAQEPLYDKIKGNQRPLCSADCLLNLKALGRKSTRDAHSKRTQQPSQLSQPSQPVSQSVSQSEQSQEFTAPAPKRQQNKATRQADSTDFSSQSQSQSQQLPPSESTTDEPAPKRPRGRPKKHPVPQREVVDLTLVSSPGHQPQQPPLPPALPVPESERLDIGHKDIDVVFAERSWLSDEVIMLYGNHVLSNATGRQFHFVNPLNATTVINRNNTSLYCTADNIDGAQLIVVTLCNGAHWRAVTVDLDTCVAFFYNPHGMNHYSRTGQAAELHLFRRVLCAQHSDGVFGAFGSGDGLDFIRMGQQQTKRGYEWSENCWTFVALEPASPQTNSWDCGIFVLAFVKAMILGIDFDVTESDMPRIRHIINWELQYSALKPFLVDEYSPAGRVNTILYKN